MTAARIPAAASFLALLLCACDPEPLAFKSAFPGDTGTVDLHGNKVKIECPNIEAVDSGGRGSAAMHDTANTIRATLAGEIALIPEYHDCQRLIHNNGNRYGPLVGIFASEALGPITEAEFRRPEGMPVAQIYNFSSFKYPILNIEPRFSCLYLQLDVNDRWHAALVHMGGQNNCPPLRQWPAGGGLDVSPTVISGGGEPPPVARWDWDAQRNQNYMAVKCLEAWCEIGNGPLNKSNQRPGVVKGWYDEQALAVPHPSDKLRPEVTATIVPEPNLDSLTDDHFNCPDPCDKDSGWVRVATVVLAASSTHYRSKMNFTIGDNELYLRMKTRPGERVWQARIINSLGDTDYRQTLRVSHTGHPVPGTARWHWREDDERAWVRCAFGCCSSGSERISPDDWS